MCIGIPMQIVDYQGELAVCESQGERRLIDMMLVGRQEIGTWVLVFLDSAREVLSEQRAEQIATALQALALSLQGETDFDHLFADLVNREPQLPAFLSEEQS